MSTERIQKYAALIRQFLDRRIDAGDFERTYLDLYKNECPGMSVAEFSALDKLFGAVDAYCPDSALRSEDDLDEIQLREAAVATLAELQEIPAAIVNA